MAIENHKPSHKSLLPWHNKISIHQFSFHFSKGIQEYDGMLNMAELKNGDYCNA